METIFIHLLKSSGIAFLFLACYYLFLKKETFFNANRWFLLTGILVSFLLPFITLTKKVLITSSTTNFTVTENILPSTPTPEQFNWSTLLFIIYIIGVVVFIVKLLIQLTAIQRLINSTQIQKKENFYLVDTTKNTSPFSFFKYIFYNSTLFNSAELSSVLDHEKVHASQYHSLDILLTELLFITQWFNPAMWWYKKSIKQNLEFMADSKAYSKATEKKFYQYLMLKQAVGINKSSIVNPFYNSLIKKRIVMLNQNQSKKSKLFKMLFMLPVLALFLVSFNTETVYVTPSDETEHTAEKDKLIEVIINKDTSENELLEMKKTMTKEGVDFSYTVVHNKDGEIINISIQVNTDDSSSTYDTNSDSPIKTIVISIDKNKNISISSADGVDKKIFIRKHSDADNDGNSYSYAISDNDDDESNVWVQSTNNKQRTIEISNVDGKEITKVDGKVVTKDEFNKMKLNNVIVISYGDENKIIKIEDKKNILLNGKKITQKEYDDYTNNISSSNKSIIVIPSSKIDSDIEISEHEDTITFRHSKNNYKKPLYFVDGKKTTKKRVEKLNPDDIKSVNVIKDDSAIKKYGEKAKNGVVEITMKKEDYTNPIYIVDGKESSSTEARKLVSEKKVEKMNILKDESAIKKYGEKGKNGVIEITTKE